MPRAAQGFAEPEVDQLAVALTVTFSGDGARGAQRRARHMLVQPTEVVRGRRLRAKSRMTRWRAQQGIQVRMGVDIVATAGRQGRQGCGREVMRDVRGPFGT